MTDVPIATGPDDIAAAIDIVRRLLGDGRADGGRYQLTVSRRPAVNNAVAIALALLVRSLITVHTDELGGDPAGLVATLIGSLKSELPGFLNSSTWTKSG